MISDDRDFLTGVYSLSKFMSDMTPNRVHKLLVVALVNVKAISDHFGLNEGDESVKRVARELDGAYGDHVYRISGARFVVRDPDLTRLFDLPHQFGKRESVATRIVRVDPLDPAAVEIRTPKDLLFLLNAIRMDDLGDPVVPCLRFPAR